MRKIALSSAAVLSTLVLAAPQAEARPLGVGAAIGAGVAGLAVGSLIGAAAADSSYGYGYDYSYPAYDYPAYGAYSWGGPEFAGYAYEPAGYAYPTTEVDTTIVSRPRTVSRTVVSERYTPAYRASYGYGYESRTVRRGYDRPLVAGAYGATYGREYGHRYGRDYSYRTVAHRGFSADYRRSYRGERFATRGYGSEGGYRSRASFRNVSERGYDASRGFESRDITGERFTGREGFRSGRAGFRNVSAGSNETVGGRGHMMRGSEVRGAQMGMGAEGERGFGRGSQGHLQ